MAASEAAKKKSRRMETYCSVGEKPCAECDPSGKLKTISSIRGRKIVSRTRERL